MSYDSGTTGTTGTPPPNYLVIAILSILCCWPLGIPATVFAAQVNGKYASGDAAGAAESSRKAKLFATIGLVVGVVLNVINGILLATGVYSYGG